MSVWLGSKVLSVCVVVKVLDVGVAMLKGFECRCGCGCIQMF